MSEESEQEELKRIRKEIETYCQCGHNELTHIHFNGGYLPEGVPTYCGYPSKVGDEYVECECNKFQALA